jgi:hypothetical protein
MAKNFTWVAIRMPSLLAVISLAPQKTTASSSREPEKRVGSRVRIDHAC